MAVTNEMIQGAYSAAKRCVEKCHALARQVKRFVERTQHGQQTGHLFQSIRSVRAEIQTCIDSISVQAESSLWHAIEEKVGWRPLPFESSCYLQFARNLGRAYVGILYSELRQAAGKKNDPELHFGRLIQHYLQEAALRVHPVYNQLYFDQDAIVKSLDHEAQQIAS